MPENSGGQPTLELPGVLDSPNIHEHPGIYEIENRAADPDGLLEQAMWRIAPWAGKIVLDLGSGTGFHVPRFHKQASRVFAVEPHGPSHLRAMARFASLGLERASAIRGSAEDIPLPDKSVDVAHARFAYFFGPGSERGLAELQRVMHTGGTAFIIANDLTQGEFADWLRLNPHWNALDPHESETFYGQHGFKAERIPSEWRFDSREDFESVVRIEFPEDIAETIIREHTGTSVSYGYLLLHRTY